MNLPLEPQHDEAVHAPINVHISWEWAGAAGYLCCKRLYGTVPERFECRLDEGRDGCADRMAILGLSGIGVCGHGNSVASAPAVRAEGGGHGSRASRIPSFPGAGICGSGHLWIRSFKPLF